MSPKISLQLQGSRSHISAKGGWGTLKYMAPEAVHQPSENFEFRNVVDIWSLGVILHQLLHDGQTPHEFLLARAGPTNKLRLALGIADARCARAIKEVDWIVEAMPGAKVFLEDSGGLGQNCMIMVV